MTTWIAFLRGLNVRGRTVAMTSLEAEFRALGLRDARAFRATGNVGFTASSGRLPAEAARLREGLSRVTHGPVELFLRSVEELGSLAATHPFAEPRPATRYVTFLPDRFDGPTDARRLPSTEATEIVLRRAREVLCWGHPVDGRSTFPNLYFERTLRVPTTTRNWSTIEGLLERYGAAPDPASSLPHARPTRRAR